MTKYEYCYVCQRNLDSVEWKKHNYTNNHKYKLKKFLKYQFDAIKKCTLPNIDNVSKKRKSSLNDNDVRAIYENSLSFECRYCKFKVSNDVEKKSDPSDSEMLKIL